MICKMIFIKENIKRINLTAESDKICGISKIKFWRLK